MRARKWLNDAPAGHGAWSIIWLALWEAAGKTDDDLRVRARKWLDDVPVEHGSWAFIWLALWEAAGKTDDDLRARARKWLDDAPSALEQWKYVWQELWILSGKADVELRALGDKWLDIDIPQQSTDDTNPWHWKDAWEMQWNDADGNSTRRQVLAQRAKTWLSEFDPKRGGWTSVWKTLWQAANATEQSELGGIADAWLQRVDPSHPRWASIWLIVFASNSARQDFRVSLARDWLNGLGKRTDWHLVWWELWRIPIRDDAMRNAARSRRHQLSLVERRRIQDQLRDQ
jgi:hypothetical protein